MENEELFKYIPIAKKPKEEVPVDNTVEKPEDTANKESDIADDILKPYLSKNESPKETISKFIPSKKEKVHPLDKAYTLIASTDDTYTIKRFVELDRIISNSNYRKYLLWWAISIISLHIFAVLGIVTHNNTIVSVFDFKPFYISVSDNVLMVLLGSTTANIIGLGYIVLKGIFYKDDIHNDNSGLDVKEDNPIS